MTARAVALAEALRLRLGGTWRVSSLGVSGFCACWRARSVDGVLFLKSLPSPQADPLLAEADGLAALAATATIRVPAVVLLDETATGDTLLALEWLELQPVPKGCFGIRFGEQLAALHGAQAPGAGRYGWPRDNWLGATPQRNGWSRTSGHGGWVAFYAESRLGPLLDRYAAQDGDVTLCHRLGRLIAALPELLAGAEPRPSLIHGDLWCGNWGCLSHDEPVIFDPALAVADAAAELAMMELFGSPPAGFWPAYRANFPLAADYPRRRPLYQLYHLLNHEVLFGAYAGAVDRCLAAVGH